MSNLTNDPFTAITVPPATNTDLPGGDFPSLARIVATDLVGPDAANRQHAASERRSIIMRDRINKMIDFLNLIDTTFLRRDGSAQKDAVSGLTADVPANGHSFTGMRAAAATGEAVRFDEFAALLATVNAIPAFPVGMLGSFPCATVPSGWIAANGSLYGVSGITTAEGASISYPGGYSWSTLNNLRILLGSTWGGDGVNSFKVPDYRGRVIVGAGTGFGAGLLTARANGAYGGEESHTLDATEIPAHSHVIEGDTGTSGTGFVGSIGQSSSHTAKGSTNPIGGGLPHNNMPPYATALVCIKY